MTKVISARGIIFLEKKTVEAKKNAIVYSKKNVIETSNWIISIYLTKRTAKKSNGLQPQLN